MKFELDTARAGLSVSGYDEGGILIGDTRHTRPLVITPEAIHTDLLPHSFAELSLDHLFVIAALGVEILIIGTGSRQILTDARLIAQMGARGIGVEIMGNPAACRCYNVLVAEHRAVAAALFIGG